MYGTRAIQDAVVSASEIIMWCDVSQVSEKCYVSFFFSTIFFFFSKTVSSLCLPISNVLVWPAKRALCDHDTTVRGGCVSFAVKISNFVSVLEFGVHTRKDFPRFFATFFSHRIILCLDRASVSVCGFFYRQWIPGIYDYIYHFEVPKRTFHFEATNAICLKINLL